MCVHKTTHLPMCSWQGSQDEVQRVALGQQGTTWVSRPRGGQGSSPWWRHLLGMEDSYSRLCPRFPNWTHVVTFKSKVALAGSSVVRASGSIPGQGHYLASLA